MNVERSIGRHRIGGWEFSPASGELRRRTDLRRLEPRAARALQMLCEAAGDVVSHEQLIERVWQGRALSENSVAVVIGQLRKALDDDAREPKLIETIPKRGYRLHATAAAAAEAPARRRHFVSIAIAALALVIAAAAWTFSRPAAPSIGMSDVTNATGNAAYDPLVRATSELIVADLGERGFAVRRDGGGDLRLASKLVMWDGSPYLGMTATDAKRVVRWSAMIAATEGKIPRGVAAELDGLAAQVRGEGRAQRLADPQGHR
jgi:DNA-binding winged helix-turn-helix (wHTH) protein